MGKINLLSFEVANLIAAGEVVDRPSSAVKELLENAIDSGAENVTVEIKRGGVAFIRVADDGCGMEKDDLVPAITRHSTSKIQSAADLDSILTLGFRGEALAAIASVSRLRIFSKPADAPLGALLEAEGGRVLSVAETGCQDGTTVIVEDLFYNVPARRKFLKKDSTEAVAIGAVVEKIALSRPDISFKLISDGEIKFMTSGKGDLREVIWALFGRETASRALQVDRSEGGIRVSGFVSEPDLYRPNRNLENFFINGRYIKSKTASAALEQAYTSKIPQDKFPFCVLNLELNPAAVDVNVHPAKLEVKFANEKLIFDAVYYAALSALEAAAIRPELSLAKESAPADPYRKQPDAKETVNPYRTGSDFFRTVKAGSPQNAFVPLDKREKRAEQMTLRDTTAVKPVLKPSAARVSEELPVFDEPSESAAELNRRAYENIKLAGAIEVPVSEAPLPEPPDLPENTALPAPDPSNVIPEPPSEGAALPESEPAPFSEDEIPDYLLLGEAFNCYVIVQIADRILLIDKHAAHERILFDELCRKMRSNLHGSSRLAGQLLMAPYPVDLTSAEADAIGEHEDKLRALGFGYTMEKTGVSTYRAQLTEIPDMLDTAEAEELFTTLATKLSDVTASVESAADSFFESRLWQASCKAAIKGGRLYDTVHLRWICDRLLKKPGADNSVIRTCPHGRPVAFEIKKSSIDRQFARLT